MLDRLIGLAQTRDLTFLASKSMTISLKGGLKPGFTVRFGDTLIVSMSPVRYLGVLMDYKLNFWEQ